MKTREDQIIRLQASAALDVFERTTGLKGIEARNRLSKELQDNGDMREVIEIELTDSLAEDIETTSALCACDWNDDQLLAAQRICELVRHASSSLNKD